MKNAITFVSFGRKKEADQQEKRLKLYADIAGYNVVWHERINLKSNKQPSDEIIINTLNYLHLQDIKVDAVIVVRYDHIHSDFNETAKLIKTLSYYSVRIISVEETIDDNDPIFTEKYYSNLKS